MKKSVGLLVMTNLPKPDGDEILAAVLQRRGYFNTEKMKPESYPGCYQVTCHGKLKRKESWCNALLREVSEELGEVFQFNFHNYHSEILISHSDIMTFGIFVPIHEIRDIFRLGPDSGGLRYIDKGEIEDIVVSSPEMELSGPEMCHTIAMFPDEIEAVKIGFKVFKRDI